MQRGRGGATCLALSTSALSTTAASETETACERAKRLIEENPVIIFSNPSCCMCHVMKRLLLTLGVHPTVIESDDDALRALSSSLSAPAVFIGGELVGGLESLMGLHLSGDLLTRLKDSGALWL
ncbi:hypothetical protein AMTRI_Chr05g59980 [Amborella trichopoda]|uniref:Glutaredoxin domain-containing protein n=1 Tax=Amborella trichopoda TaxID=13333 RepID=U5CYS5_AMBTC|nr:glutaredoxin-C10 [Amborella trichopoda]ERN15329.1 hypothetical protein AMTR_s00036p00111760 [Amborella trichopoda]|eukprot:XP_011626837.1 glutaredoxin-C10 [Amborella trichopoda]